MSDRLREMIDGVYDRLVEGCPDPRAREYREEFRRAEAEARGRFERWREEALDERRRYHRLCGRDEEGAEAEAASDVRLLAIDVRRELDELVRAHWQRFTERLSRLVEELKEAAEGETR